MSTAPFDDEPSKQAPFLSSLIASRICHDLISPIGAITNGLELMALSERTSSPELGLIEDSVAQAALQIKFFRLAFGLADPSPQPIEEVDDLLRGFEAGGRIKVQFDAKGVITRERVRLLLLALLCIERAMPVGGEVTIAQENGSWMVQGRADRLQTTDAVWHHLMYGTAIDDLSPATVQFGLLRDGATELGTVLRVSISSARISIQL